MISRRLRRVVPIFAVSLFAFVLIPFTLTRAQNSTDPWKVGDTILPNDFVKELSDGKSAPTVLFVGFQRLYTAGHIEGAQYHGSAGSGEGLSEIKTWAGPIPRSTNLVLYCGCCPMGRCPNIRPAFTALHEMGFTRVRVLILETSFAVDWAEKRLPYEKGQWSPR